MSSGYNNLSDTTSLPYRDNQHKIKLPNVRKLSQVLKPSACQMLGNFVKSLNQTITKVRELRHATIGATF
jgi:hypothetical protein